MADTILSVRDLSTRFFTEEGQVNAVEHVSFDVEDGEIFGIVGESGSGKSVTALSVIDLIESPGRVTQGEIWYRNADLAEEFRESKPDASTATSWTSDGSRRASAGRSAARRSAWCFRTR